MSEIKVDALSTVSGSGSITVSNNLTASGNVGVNGGTGGQVATNFTSASTMGMKINDTNSGNLGGMLGFYSGSGAGTLRANIQNANNAGVHFSVGTGGSVVFTQTGYTAANALDDYEQGTFTPVLVSTGATFAYSVQQGIYTKIGDLVSFTIVVQLDGGGNSFSGNSVALNGWPFASRNSQGAASRFFIAGRYVNLDLGNGYTYAYAQLNGNSSSAPLLESGDNVPTQNLASNDLSSVSGQLYLHGHYFTDS